MKHIYFLLCVVLAGCTGVPASVDPAAIIAIESALADLPINDTIPSVHQDRERGKAKRLTPGVPSISLDHPAEPVPDASSSSHILRRRRRGFFNRHKSPQKSIGFLDK